MGKPVIGIVDKPSLVSDMWHYMEIVDEIRYALVRNGALVVGVLPTERGIDFKNDEEVDDYVLSSEERADIEFIVDKLDGLIQEGGLVSNKYEEEIAKVCIEKDVPLMGFCSGFNNLVRALGGKVHVDENIFHNQFGMKIAHDVVLDENSKLFKILGKSKVHVNSIHTCIADESEIEEYKVVAKCPNDNTVEAIELEGKRFVIGIKWYPELMDTMNPIFEEFVRECSGDAV